MDGFGKQSDDALDYIKHNTRTSHTRLNMFEVRQWVDVQRTLVHVDFMVFKVRMHVARAVCFTHIFCLNARLWATIDFAFEKMKYSYVRTILAFYSSNIR